VKGKNTKTATASKPEKSQGQISLLMEDETGPGKIGKIKLKPESNFVEPIPGVTQEDLEARAAAERKMIESPEAEIYPGITQGALTAKLAAEQSFDLKTAEVLPGMTQAQLEAKHAAEKATFDPKTAEVIPGMTQAQVEAKSANQRNPDKRELVPPAGIK